MMVLKIMDNCSDRMTSHKHDLAAKIVQLVAPEVASFEMNFFRIVDTNEADTLQKVSSYYAYGNSVNKKCGSSSSFLSYM